MAVGLRFAWRGTPKGVLRRGDDAEVLAETGAELHGVADRSTVGTLG